ncbi:CAP domain-containing protein KNAG_0B01940 [Huiozyma naganishii CBS 8797]|uniref:SCP domain-containing protein n=1 Tax=Huiozyma naganishii (strain ATCC MYA-139 / BCRC 22969 / CBS 8797 / KCTC 17520 / NBRC 10181 / NCYC 3082 / Yp74L-3) TaxID=1071383 RepID=J7S4K8_HUIN7|nr:hypothetical protein KNAG_0B01940 [Kazachstania naganishii CBS 8797]CCK68636.1 hypothetical protein KNAG_0B01940 [Kazachstania naganishii CBS 8797]
MQFSKSSILATLTATTVLAAPAVVTVTEHAHAGATVTGVVYATDGETKTAYNAPLTTAIDSSLVESGNQGSPAPVAASSVVDAPVLSDDDRSKFQAFVSAIQNMMHKQDGDATTTQAEATVATQATTAPATTEATNPTTTLAPTTTAEAPKATATSQNSDLSDFASSILAEHNNKRALHKDTGSLSWSSELASYAQNYADGYDCSGNLQHSGGPYGENLALGYNSGSAAVDAWYGEISGYDWSNPGFSGNTGHFTQVVWKSTNEVGCGVKQCGNSWGNYVICSYKSAGNMGGEYDSNVMPLL